MIAFVRLAACESAAVALGDRPERCLGLPGHVRVGFSVAAFESLDDAPACEVEVIAWVAVRAVWEVAELEAR